MASQPKKRTPRGTRKAKTRARGAKSKVKRRSPGGRATRSGTRSKPKRTRRASRKSGRRARQSRRTEASVDAQTFEERFTPEGELAKRAADAMAGDEEPGGSVSTPDHDLVDQWAGALGAERSPDSPVRSSAEVLDDRDRRRGGRRPAPKV